MKYLYNLVACIFLLCATACYHHNEVPEPEPQPTHTLLVYMAGDNSLSDYCKTNIRLMKEALMDATEDLNLVIYKDNRSSGDGLPSLFQLKRTVDKKTHIAKIDTVYLEKFNVELNSCDPTVLKDIVNKTFSTFNTEVKGLEIWSHGLSWVPSSNFRFNGKSATRGVKYVGQDDNHYMELWDLRVALESCPHLDYILFDACFAGMAEVANELDGVCDYIYGPITEIMGFGFPYNSMVRILSYCNKKADVERTLTNCVTDFSQSDLFSRNGFTITLLETAKANSLAKSIAKLRMAAPEASKYLEDNCMIPEVESAFQHYGRSLVGARYYFYEIADYVNYLSKDGSTEVKSIVKEIEDNDIVVSYAYSNTFVEGSEKIDLKGCKGLGISIPEFFYLTGQENLLKKTYGKTKWGKTLGY